MVEHLIPMGIASLLGFLAGMGVGGGSLLLLWLTQVAMMEQPQARILNLLFFLPSAVVSTLFRIKQKVIQPGVTLPALIAGCSAALIFTMISRSIDIEAFKKLLGGLLILTGIREIFYRPRNAR